MATRQQLLEAGKAMLLRHGYHALGLASLLETTGIPKGSFYHHFESKEDFGLQVIDLYMTEVHAGLDACLHQRRLPPLERVRRFFELSERKYRDEGYLGCLLGGLGQELSGVSDIFRTRVEQCFAEIAGRICVCLDEAVASGELPAGTATRAMADLLVNAWEGAALRTRLRREPGPLVQMLDFYFRSASPGAILDTTDRSAKPRRGSVNVRRTKGVEHDRVTAATGTGGHRRRRGRAS